MSSSPKVAAFRPLSMRYLAALSTSRECDWLRLLNNGFAPESPYAGPWTSYHPQHPNNSRVSSYCQIYKCLYSGLTHRTCLHRSWIDGWFAASFNEQNSTRIMEK